MMIHSDLIIKKSNLPQKYFVISQNLLETYICSDVSVTDVFFNYFIITDTSLHLVSLYPGLSVSAFTLYFTYIRFSHRCGKVVIQVFSVYCYLVYTIGCRNTGLQYNVIDILRCLVQPQSWTCLFLHSIFRWKKGIKSNSVVTRHLHQKQNAPYSCSNKIVLACFIGALPGGTTYQTYLGLQAFHVSRIQYSGSLQL